MNAGQLAGRTGTSSPLVVDFAVGFRDRKRGALLVRGTLLYAWRQGIGWRPLMKYARDSQGGALLRPWLPMTWMNRLIAMAIVVLGVQEAWIGNYHLLIWWLTLPLFSPRIMSECANALGLLARL